MLSQYTSTVMSTGATHAVALTDSMGKIYQQLLTQASFLAYRDVFQFVTCIVFALGLVALMMPRINMNKKPAADAAPAH
jgi:DHA2 family multidrug resistance protein